MGTSPFRKTRLARLRCWKLLFAFAARFLTALLPGVTKRVDVSGQVVVTVGKVVATNAVVVSAKTAKPAMVKNNHTC